VYIVKYIVTLSRKPYLPRDEYDESCKEIMLHSHFFIQNILIKHYAYFRINWIIALPYITFPYTPFSLQVLSHFTSPVRTSTFILTALLKADRQFLHFVNVPYWLVLYHQQLITVTPCTLIDIDHCFGGTCCLHLQLRNISQRGDIKLRYGDWRIGHCTISKPTGDRLEHP
jgi:hypothetical protein